MRMFARGSVLVLSLLHLILEVFLLAGFVH